MPLASPLKLLVFGLDGADYDLTAGWIESGHLPNLASLAARGSLGPLATVSPPITPAAWTSLITGKNPGKHGVYAFHRLWAESDELTLAPPSRAVTVFRILEAAGLRVGVFNVPWTYPPEPLEGFVVSGAGAPQVDASIGHPEGIVEALVEAVGPYDVWPTRIIAGEQLDDGILEQQMQLVTDGLLALLAQFPCDAVMSGSMLPDMVQHGFFGNRSAMTTSGEQLEDAIRHTYERVDAALGRLLRQACDENTVVIVASDHGGVPADRLVNLEQLFIERGYLARRPKEGATRADSVRRSLARPALALWTAAKAALPAFVVDRLRGTARRARGDLARGFSSWATDWSRTVAAPWSNNGTIRINLKDRDPQGIVDSEDYGKVREEIAGFLTSLRDPEDGGPVFEAIHRQEELFEGPYAEEGPDLQLEGRDWRYVMPTARHPETLDLLEVQPEPIVRLERPWGSHGPKGILLMAGAGVEPGVTTEGASLMDVAPTLLALLDVPVPSDMDGRVLTEALRPAARSRVRSCAPLPLRSPADERHVAYSAEEQQQIERRLAEMGYI